MPGRFWKIYLICVTAVSVLLAVGFSAFYSFIGSYEQSQPDYAIKQYADSLSNSNFTSVIYSCLPDEISPYETEDTVISAYIDALKALDGAVTVRKDFKKYTSDAPAYIILKAGTQVAEVTMSGANSGSFGMKRWKIASFNPFLENWAPQATTYTFFVPKGASLRLNGVSVTSDCLTGTDAPYRYKSEYEPDASASCDVYEIDGLYTMPTVVCALDGEVCAAEENGTSYFVQYPKSSVKEYTVTVPEGAAVTVNGIALADSTILKTDIPYTYHPLEATAENLPTAVTYSITGLFSQPEIIVTLDGIELPHTLDGTAFEVPYPESSLYTCEIRVPAGAEVSTYGQILDPAVSVREPVFPELVGLIDNIPEYDVYTVSGLYAPLAAHTSVRANGEVLPQSSTVDENAETVHAAYPVVQQDAVADLAHTFTKDYITYTSQGYNNIDANLQRALSHVLYGTDTYTRIANSRIGIWYVTPVTSNEYRSLEVVQIMQYSEDMYRCTVAFDVAQQTYYIHNDYSGTLELVVAKKYGAFRIVDMYLHTEK
ncbi:MAG: hypothetical protein IJZ08_01660 [Clostridia bacterium]|nr:hypothetical protein [Clostridia bacterium]